MFKKKRIHCLFWFVACLFLLLPVRYSYADFNRKPLAQGIDVSSWQGSIDWTTVKSSGISFAYLRIGPVYGNKDSTFERNANECERLGIPYGIYYYSYAASVSDARREADNVISWLGGHRPQLPIYLDVEDKRVLQNNSYDKRRMASNICAFTSRIESFGFDSGLYANLYWLNNYLNDSSLLNIRHWVAQYNPSGCSYQNDYVLWQYSSTGVVPGISGNVDCDYAYEYPDAYSYRLVESVDRKYCYDLKGNKILGELHWKGHWYYFNPSDDGAMAIGFFTLPSGKTVLYGEDGAMLYGEQRVDGRWYNFDRVTGAMSTGLTDLGYKTVLYGEDGAMLYGLQQVEGSGERYFDRATGELCRGRWVDDLGTRRRVDDDGSLAEGERLVDGHWYWFAPGSEGGASTGFQDVPDGSSTKRVYYGPDGAMLYGEQRVDGRWYWFDRRTGAMATGLTDIGYKTVLYGEDGAMLYGLQQVEGKGYLYFDLTTGALCDYSSSID